MVSHCANPNCATPLRYLRDGRLFQFEIKASAVKPRSDLADAKDRQKLSRKIWHFWLCGQCAPYMTLEFDGSKGLKIIPLTHVQPHCAMLPQLAS